MATVKDVAELLYVVELAFNMGTVAGLILGIAAAAMLYLATAQRRNRNA